MTGPTRDVSGHNALIALLRDFAEEVITDLRVCLPGRIEEYDPDTMLANVQPLLKLRFYGRTGSELLPIVNNVPIHHPRTATALLRLPVTRGDIVTLVFSDRSIENWLQGSGEEREALDTRKHNLSDAFAFLGGYPRGGAMVANNPDAVELVVEPGTKITLGNGDDEILQLAHDAFTSLKSLTEKLSQTLTDIQLITHVDPQGGTSGTPLNASDFATIKTTVDTLTTDVQTALTGLENLKV